MGFIDYRGNCQIHGTDYQKVQTCRIIESSMCIICRKQINKGCVCLGKGGHKICLDCADELFRRIRNEFEYFLSVVKRTEQELKDNNDKYRNNNLISNI